MTVELSTIPLRELRSDISQQVFHVLMEALSRPGTIGQLPLKHDEPEATRPHQSVVLPLLALTDLMVTVAALPHTTQQANGPTAQHLVQEISRVTGAEVVTPARARFALALGEPTDFAQLNAGSNWSPETGAMLIQHIPDVTVSRKTVDDATDAWMLSGPGIPPDETRVLTGHGLSATWRQTRNNLCAGYPSGIDCLLVTPDGRVVGLPRTTTISQEA